MTLSYDALRDKAALLHKQWPPEKRVFELLTGWAKSYDDLFEGQFQETLGEADVLALVQGSGRAILSGRGGSGKTRLLRRLYRRALIDRALPLYVDLKQWNGSDYEAWQAWTCDDPRNGGDFLLKRFGNLAVGALELDRISPNIRKLIIVDGLNEMNATVGGEILVLLDEIVRNQMSTSVIVADRLIRRDLPNPSRWRIGTTLPLSKAEIRKHLGAREQLAEHDIRTSPFFLNVQIESTDRRQSGGRAVTLEQWLREHSTLSAEEIDRTSSAAFDAYVDQHTRSRVFSATSFSKIASQQTVEKLQASGVLVSNGVDAFFDHHIVHDFLASRHLAKLDPREWVPRTFRAVTFEGSSIDPLELAFEQLDANGAERFLRALYDWNLYAAGYVLGHAGSVGHVVGREMRTVMCAMLAEKRFDAILATRERALDALRLIPTQEARTFRDAASLSDICHALIQMDVASDWFASWRKLYCLQPGDSLPRELLGALNESDSIVGWTVANVLRRFSDLAWAVPELEGLLNTALNPTVRWRAVHVLGSIPTPGSAELLVKTVQNDDDLDVRFGAVRAIIEVALHSDPSGRDRLGKRLEELAPTIAQQPKLSRELRACLLADPNHAPADWLDFVRAAIRSQFVSVERLSEQDGWRGCLFAAETLYPETKSMSAGRGA